MKALEYLTGSNVASLFRAAISSRSSPTSIAIAPG